MFGKIGSYLTTRAKKVMDPYGGLTEQEWEELPQNIAAREKERILLYNRTDQVKQYIAIEEAHKIRRREIGKRVKEANIPAILKKNRIGTEHPQYGQYFESVAHQITTEFDEKYPLQDIAQSVYDLRKKNSIPLIIVNPTK